LGSCWISWLYTLCNPSDKKLRSRVFGKIKKSKERSRVSFCLLVYLFKSVSSFKFIYIESTLLPVLGEDYSCYWSEIRKKNGLID